MTHSVSGVLPPMRGIAGAPDAKGDRSASVIVALLITVLAVRLHELIPGSGVIRPAVTLSIGGLAFLIGRAPAGSLGRVLRARTSRLVMGYFALACIGVPFALWRGGAIGSVRDLAWALVLFLAVMLCPPTRAALDRVLTGFALAAGAYATMLITRGTARVEGRVSIGYTLDANDAAALFAIAAPIAISMVTGSRGLIRRLVGAAILGVLVVGVLKTGSRGGLIALAVGTLVYVMGQPGFRKAGLIVAMLIGGAFTWAAAPQSFKDRFSSVSDEKDYNFNAYGGRLQIWSRAIGYTAKSPVVGVGIGNFSVAELITIQHLSRAEDAYGVIRGGMPDMNTHNAYLQAAAELGIPGVIVFVMLIGTAIKLAGPLWRPSATRRGFAHHPEVLASMLAFASGAMFLSHAYSYALFALVGLVDRAAAAYRFAPANNPAPAPIRLPTPPQGGRRVAFGLRTPDAGHPGAIGPGSR